MEALEKAKKFLGILNPQNIITDNERKLLLEAKSIKQQNSDASLKTINSNELMNEIDANLIQRTQVRFLTQELRKQNNLEQIFKKTEQALQNEQVESQETFSEPLNEDWLSYYIEGASKISDEQVQDLWAKILAGEIITPKTFSKRTLDVLLRLSQEEAKLFEKICRYVVEIDDKLILINEENFNPSNYFTYLEILRLGECGLINSSTTNSLNANIAPTDKFAIVYGKDVIIGETTKQEKIHLQIFPLTVAGTELIKIILPTRKYDYLKELTKYLRNKYKDIAWNINQILSREGKNIRYVKIDMNLIINEIKNLSS